MVAGGSVSCFEAVIVVFWFCLAMSAHIGAAFRHNRTKKVCASAPTDGLVPTAAAVRKLPTMQVVVNSNARWRKCFDQPKDCKTISDTTERLKCFDAQSAGAPAAAPASTSAPAPEPAARILKAEPPGGQLPTGARVWIDDGSCPAGCIKQVVGGDVSLGQARTRSCVPRP